MTDEPEPGILGQRLRELRERLGLSLYELDRRSGIPRSRLLRLENGTTRQPTPDTMNRLAVALEVDPEEFYDAVWQDADSPLPSLSTYFRAKYQLTDEQIATMQNTLNEIDNAKRPARRARQHRE
jgi:transcriptional regulator with XRE-family HTH domain